MTEGPTRIRIDRVVLRNVDDANIGDLAGLVAARLREGPAATADGPIPRGGSAMTEAAADRIAQTIRLKLPPK